MTILYIIILLYYTILYYIILYYTILYYIILYYMSLVDSVSQICVRPNRSEKECPGHLPRNPVFLVSYPTIILAGF